MEKTLGQLAEFLGGVAVGDTAAVITGVKGIEEAGAGDITFVANPKYMKFLETTAASAVIVAPDVQPQGKS
ncbi:MAG: UDP-3-O-(3-hydroxymyristoyl)glucosamine N-acyltransferase, partial [Spirochaetales bacterium]